MRIIGCIFIMIVSVLIGISASNNQNEIANYTKLAYQMLRRLKMLLRYSQLEKNHLLYKLRNEGYSVVLDAKSKGAYIDNYTENIISQYISQLGSRDMDSELEALEYATNLVLERFEQVKTLSMQKSKLYLSLGVLLGTFVVIIMI